MATVAAATLLLGACSAGDPGVAAAVEGDTITDTEVDDFAQVLCSLSATPGAPASTPTAEARFQSLQILLSNELAADVADVDAVSRADVEGVLAQAAAARDALPEDMRDAYEQAVIDYAVAQFAVIQAGRRFLRESGVDARQIDDQAAFTAGEELRQEYARSAEISVDPRFGELVDGTLQPSGGALSVPVSDFAVAATDQPPGEAFLSTLPVSQTCG